MRSLRFGNFPLGHEYGIFLETSSLKGLFQCKIQINSYSPRRHHGALPAPVTVDLVLEIQSRGVREKGIFYTLLAREDKEKAVSLPSVDNRSWIKDQESLHLSSP